MLDFLSQNKNWIFEGVGVWVLGGVVTVLAWAARQIYFRVSGISAAIPRYEGCYEVYRFKVRDNGQVTRVAAEVKATWMGRLRVTLRSDKYRMHGTLAVKFHNIYISLRSEARDVRALWIFHEPLNQFDFLIGVSADITLAGLPTASKILLLKVPATSVDRVVTGELHASEVDPRIVSLLTINSSRRVNVAIPPSHLLRSNSESPPLTNPQE